MGLLLLGLKALFWIFWSIASDLIILKSPILLASTKNGIFYMDFKGGGKLFSSEIGEEEVDEGGWDIARAILF